MCDLRTIAVGRPKRRATLLEQLRAGLTNRSRSKTLRRILEFARRDVASVLHYVDLLRNAERLSRAIRELRHLWNEIKTFYRTTKLDAGLNWS